MNGKSESSNIQDAKIQIDSNNEPSKGLQTAPVKNKYDFKIQLGEYNEEVPNDIATIYLQLADKGINHFVNQKGLTVYTLGNYDDFKEAEIQKNELINQYKLNDAKVIAFDGDKQVPLNEVINK